MSKGLPTNPKGAKKKRRRKRNPQQTRDRFDRTISDLMEEQVSNAGLFIRQLLSPDEVSGQRYPEPISEGTMTLHLKQRLGVARVTAGTDHVSAVIIHPNLVNHAWAVTGGTSILALTWGVSNHGQLAVATDNLALYRCVGLGIRFINMAPLLNQGAAIYVGTLPPKSSATSPPADLYSALTAMDSITVLSSDVLREEGADLYLSWLPCTYQGAVGTGAGTYAEATGLGLRVPLENACWDNSIIIFAVLNSATSDNFLMEVDFHVEGMPLSTKQPIFDLGSVVGSPAALADATSIAMRDAGGTKSSFFATGVRIGKELVKSLAHDFGGKTLQTLMSVVDGTGGSHGKSMLLGGTGRGVTALHPPHYSAMDWVPTPDEEQDPDGSEVAHANVTPASWFAIGGRKQK